MVPGATHWLCGGESATVGLARPHETGPKFTITTAPVLVTDAGVMVTPASGSLKL